MPLLPLAFTLLLVYWALFAPGVLDADSIDMMLQGEVWDYHTWHSVVMAWIWRQLQRIIKGPLLMMVLIQGLFVSAATVAVVWFIQRPWARALGLLGLGLFPWTLPMVAHVSKNSLVAALLMWTALLLWLVMNAPESKRWGWMVLLLGTAVLAGAVRVDSVAASTPFVGAAVYHCFSKTRGRAAAVGASLIALYAGVVAVSATAAWAVKAVVRNPVQVSMGWDLAGIAVRTGDLRLPGYAWKSGLTMAAVQRAYNPADCMPLFWQGPGLSIPLVNGRQELAELASTWAAAIGAHPGAFVRHRLEFATHLMGFRRPEEYMLFTWGPAEEKYLSKAHEWNAHYQRGFFAGVIEANLKRLAATPVLRCWPYVVVLVVGLVWGLRSESARARWVAVVSASGLLHVALMLVAASAALMRYLYWPVLASLLVAVGIAGSWKGAAAAPVKSTVKARKR